MKLAVMSDEHATSVVPVKCVVWDLDGTLWDGIISEQDSDCLMPKGNVVDVIKTLDARGILNSIASKNELDLVQKRLETVGLWEYFLLPQIHWGAKSESIKTIATEIGIGVDSIAFIDDDERERAEVRSVFNCVRTYDPSQLDSLLQKPEFSVPVSETTSSRRQMYLEEFKRRAFRNSSGLSNDGFLEELNLTMSVHEGMCPEVEQRIVELLKRANNWHLTGHREWTSTSLDTYKGDGRDVAVLSYMLEDKFGGYGCVGVSLLEVDKVNNALCVNELVMSCRAAAKTVDVAIIREVAKFAIAHGVNRIVFRLFFTDRNIPIQRFLCSVCANHIMAKEDGFVAEIPDARAFLNADVKCFVKTHTQKDKPMKARTGYSIKTLGEKCYLTADVLNASQPPCLILLNKTGKILWELLQQQQTEDSLADGLAQKFGIGKEEVLEDVHDFIMAAANANLIEGI